MLEPERVCLSLLSLSPNISDSDLGLFPLPPPSPYVLVELLIIGAGHFGKRAAEILSKKSEAPVFILDNNKRSLSDVGGISVEKILCDGVNFLVKNFHFLSPSFVFMVIEE